jgi:hypothetical protein
VTAPLPFSESELRLLGVLLNSLPPQKFCCGLARGG